MSGTRTVVVASSLDELHRRSAQYVAQTIAAAVAARGRCAVALSGGSTPRGTYALLAAPPLRDVIPWASVHLYWGDERCVPADHADSNYHMAHEALLAHVPVPPGNVHRARTELGNPEAVAADYEREVRAHVGADDGVPRFDLIMLGLGPDGHTASLFPGSAALDEATRLVVPNGIDYMPHPRVTFTLPLLNAARAVQFLVAGAGKAPVVARAMNGDPAVVASRVCPTDGVVRWDLDRAAAGE